MIERAEQSRRVKRKWLPLNALRAFEAVADALSFTAGAQALNVTQSATSRQVATLEAWIGRKLLLRTPQGLQLTSAGAALLPILHKSFDRIDEAIAELREPDSAERILKLHFPASFLQQLALPLLAEFRQRFTEISLDVSSSNHLGPPSHGCDIGVVYDRPRVSDAVRDLLWAVRVTPVCAPSLASHAASQGLQAFVAQQHLLHTRVPGQAIRHLWESFARRHSLSLEYSREMTFDTMALAAKFAAAGSGVLLADVEMFAVEIQQGQLAAPFAAELEDGDGYYLQLSAEDLNDPIIATFRSWIIERFARYASGRSAQPRPTP